MGVISKLVLFIIFGIISISIGVIKKNKVIIVISTGIITCAIGFLLFLAFILIPAM